MAQATMIFSLAVLNECNIFSSATPNVASGEKGRWAMKHVLVVDDVPEIRMVYRVLLSRSGVEVLEAGDGREALEILKLQDVSVVVTDCQMPNMTGVELMRAAKAQYPHIPFVVVSATAKEGDLDDLMPYAVMPKPFRLPDLKEVIDRALEEA